MEQIITDDGHLVQNLEEHIDRIGIPGAGLDYHMISIIGCQSSGKSTLLNLLFGTKFETMDEHRGRQQTTKGIHASCALNNPLLVFDVEGCDSRERGDADALFERKAALFALSLSEVMIVNMWESDIGRYNAANLPMLRTVFEVNVQLFQARVDAKTTLLFLIRDYTTDNFDALCQNIYNDMNNIWKEINLPPEYKNSQIKDFFDFKFYAIHHMKIQREIFDQDVERLKGWFCDPQAENYLFKESSHKNVPGDGLAQYITNLWTVIHENKELNIPSQRSMLSYFKCEENMKMAVNELIESLSDKLNNPIKKKEIIYDFCDICEPFVAKAFQYYKDNSWRYISEVVEEKYNDLKTEIHEFLYPLFVKNAELLTSISLDEFIEYVNVKCTELVQDGHWFDEINSHMKEVVGNMENKVNSMVVPPFEWKFDFESKESVMKELIDNKKAYLIDNLHSSVCSSVLHSFNESANEILKEANETMWINLRNLMSAKINEARNTIQSILDTNIPNEKAKTDISKKFEDAAIKLVKESAKYILLKMKSAFDKHFKYENNRPRIWTKDDDVNQIFDESKSAGEAVLRLFTICKLWDPNKPQAQQNPALNQILIDKDTSEKVLEGYNRIIAHTYEEAKGLIKAQMTQDQIPSFAWFILLILGGDKILKLLANPLIFTFALFFGGSYFMLKQLGLLDIVLEAIKERFYNITSIFSDDEADGNEDEDEGEDDSNLVQNNENDSEIVENTDDDKETNTLKQEEGLLDLSKPLDSLVIPELPPEMSNETSEIIEESSTIDIDSIMPPLPSEEMDIDVPDPIESLDTVVLKKKKKRKSNNPPALTLKPNRH